MTYIIQQSAQNYKRKSSVRKIPDWGSGWCRNIRYNHTGTVGPNTVLSGYFLSMSAFRSAGVSGTPAQSVSEHTAFQRPAENEVQL